MRTSLESSETINCAMIANKCQDGLQPCANCSSTSLPCTYLAVPKKKGPKGPSSRTPRAVLKMQMRHEQNGVAQGFLADIKPTPISSNGREQQKALPVDLSLPARSFVPSPLFTMAIAEQHVESFFTHKYPVFPILNRERFLATLKGFHLSPETYSLVAALCAAVISQTSPDSGSVSSPQSSVLEPTSTPEFFLTEVKRARQYHDYIEKPTLQDVQTSFFLFATLFNADRHNSAWFVLREAMTMMQMMRLHEEDTYATMDDPLYALYSRRTFWLMFLTERYVNVLHP